MASPSSIRSSNPAHAADDKLFSTKLDHGHGRPAPRLRISHASFDVESRAADRRQEVTLSCSRPARRSAAVRSSNAQHPHDFFMELAAEYAHPLTGNTIGYIYAAPFGDPSLGPVRLSAPRLRIRDPAGGGQPSRAGLDAYRRKRAHHRRAKVACFGYAFSGFHGREPDEKTMGHRHRQDRFVGLRASHSIRRRTGPHRYRPATSKHPEAAEPGDVQRTTASVAYSNATALGQWDTSLNLRSQQQKAKGHDGSSWLAESVLQFAGRNYITGRARGRWTRTSCFAEQNVPPAIEKGLFRVKALTLRLFARIFSPRERGHRRSRRKRDALCVYRTKSKPYYGQQSALAVLLRQTSRRPAQVRTARIRCEDDHAREIKLDQESAKRSPRSLARRRFSPSRCAA